MTLPAFGLWELAKEEDVWQPVMTPDGEMMGGDLKTASKQLLDLTLKPDGKKYSILENNEDLDRAPAALSPKQDFQVKSEMEMLKREQEQIAGIRRDLQAALPQPKASGVQRLLKMGLAA